MVDEDREGQMKRQSYITTHCNDILLSAMDSPQLSLIFIYFVKALLRFPIKCNFLAAKKNMCAIVILKRERGEWGESEQRRGKGQREGRTR